MREMRGFINISSSSSSCASHASTSIIHQHLTTSSSSSSMEMKSPSSSSSHPHTAPRLINDGNGGISRAIDRHNPIVTDGKRSSSSAASVPSIRRRSTAITHDSFNGSKSNSVHNKTQNTGLPVPNKEHNNKKTNEHKDGSASGTAKKWIDKWSSSSSSSSSSTIPFNFMRRRSNQYSNPLIQIQQPFKKKTVQEPISGHRHHQKKKIVNGGRRSRCGVAKHGVDYINPNESSRRYLLQNYDIIVNDIDEKGSVDGFGKPVLETGSSRFGKTEKKTKQRMGKGNSNSKSKSIGAADSEKEVVVGTRRSDSLPFKSLMSSPLKLPDDQHHDLPATSDDPPPDHTHQQQLPGHHYQVVVLKVSLHCKGCEAKLRKHISKMQGVTSFSIDFMAKKVTVEGDISPLDVLASISKVKNAQLWTPSTTLYSH